MDRIRIRGGRPLHGSIAIGGAKNAALPLMAAGMLTDERLVLTERAAPGRHRHDDRRWCRSTGCAVEPVMTAATLSIGGAITNTEAPYDIVRKMRASILVLGPLLARMRRGAGVAAGRLRDRHPAGRPAPQGARADGRRPSCWTAATSNATAPHGLHGAHIVLPFASVGATENLLMAATLADGQTVLANAAREPEIGDLAACLIAMGARIEGTGTDRLVIEGVKALHGAEHPIVADRIETGTYACAVAITGGEVRLAARGLDASGRPGACADARPGCEITRAAGRRAGAADGRAARHRCDDRAVSRASRPTCRRSSWR